MCIEINFGLMPPQINGVGNQSVGQGYPNRATAKQVQFSNEFIIYEWTISVIHSTYGIVPMCS